MKLKPNKPVVFLLAVAVPITTFVAAGPSSASHLGTAQSVTVPLPGTGSFKLCLVVGEKGPKQRIGKCTGTPLLHKGSLTVAISSAVEPPLLAVEQPAPAACEGLPGVQVDVLGMTGGTVGASIDGDGSLGAFSTSLNHEVAEPTDLAVRACFEP